MFRYQTILILLFVLGAVTCFISYLSDKMGMKLGKKRLSLKVGRFTLRPRQTATLLSMGSSLLVMFLTMAVLFATFPALRNALLRYDQTRRENTTLNRRNEQLRDVTERQKIAVSQQTKANKKLEESLRTRNFQLTNLNQKVGVAQRQVVAAQSSLEGARRNLSSATQARVEAQNARDAAKRAQQQAQNGENRARQSETSARQSATSARQNEAAARAGFVQAQARFSAAQARLVEAQQKEAQAQRGVEAANKLLKARQIQLSSTRNLLRSTRTQLQNAQTQTLDAQELTQEAQRQKLVTFGEKARAEAQLKVTNEQLKAKNEQLAEAQNLIAAADNNLTIAKGLLSGDLKVAVPSGQVFSDATIPVKTDAAQALVVLRNLLTEAAQSAKQSGFQSVQLDKVTIQQNGQPTELSDEQNLSLTAAFLAANAPVSVRVVAARDHPEGESRLLLRVQGVTVRPAFVAGEILAQTTIRGGQNGAPGDALIFNRLLALLDEGQKIAAQRKVSPIPSAAEPNLFASDTRLSIFEALRQIQQQSGDVPVRLVAARALSTIDAVRIRIEVGAPKNETSSATTSSATTSSATTSSAAIENSPAKPMRRAFLASAKSSEKP